MNKLILCEGKTDAILLSYYLGRVHHWAPCNKGPKELRISADEISGESAYWYQREEDRLLICGVGGKDKFGSFFKNKIEPAIIDAHAFSKVALVQTATTVKRKMSLLKFIDILNELSRV